MKSRAQTKAGARLGFFQRSTDIGLTKEDHSKGDIPSPSIMIVNANGREPGEDLTHVLRAAKK